MRRKLAALCIFIGFGASAIAPSPLGAVDYFGDCYACDAHGTGTSGIGSFFREDNCRPGGIYFQSELLLFQYLRADGMRAGGFNNVPPSVTDDVEFDYEAAPRLTLGYISEGGLGFRTRWFDYHHAGTPIFPASGIEMEVDTYTIDMELFERFRLNNSWDVEFSGGIRYNEFEEFMLDPIPAAAGGGPAIRRNGFNGFGGIAGVEGNRSLGRFGSLYARGRGSLLMGDRTVSNNAVADQNAILRDTTVGVGELAVGWEIRRDFSLGLLTFRSGYEWQNWFNYSSSFSPFNTAPGNDPSQFGGQSDVGFHGVSFMLGLER